MSRPPGSREGGHGTIVRPTGEGGAQVPGAGNLGMAIFLTSLTVLFGASLIAFVLIRLRAESWKPEGGPGLPATLWVSTVLVACGSTAAQAALHAIRGGRERAMLRWLWVSLGLALAFLACQGWNWREVQRAGLLGGPNLFGFTFYMLTGLHALHVAGGLVALVVVLVRAHLAAYSWGRYAGVRHFTVYWHFLTIVWVLLFAALRIAGR